MLFRSALAEKRAQIEKHQAALGAIQDEIGELRQDYTPQAAPRLKAASDSLSKKSAEIEALENESRRMNSQYEKASASAEELRSKVAETMARDFNVKLDPNADVRAQLAQLGDAHLKQARLTHASRVTDQFLDDVKSDYLKSGILVSDIATLKQQRNYTDAQLQMLQSKVDSRLENTMLGKYVQQQISKAIIASCQNPKVAAACAQGKTTELQELLRGTLGGNPAENASSVSKTKGASGSSSNSRVPDAGKSGSAR